nr:MAG: replication initiator protein [Microvirus sp.]
MHCTSPVTLLTPSVLKKFPDGLQVPCGKCLSCRITKRREWTLRLYHELATSEDAVFLTLTYDDSHLPDNGSLRKKHAQDFIKRLRRQMEYYNDTRKIRYFLSGEYGDQTQRPHYHAIIFNLSLSDTDKQLIKDQWPVCNWSNPHIAKNSFGTVTPDSIQYVAAYIDKKYSGDLATQEYVDKGREPVFKLSSKGIGRDFCDLNGDQLYDNLYTTLKGVKMSLPRYYCKRLSIPETVLKARAQDKEIELVERKTGVKMSRLDYYKTHDAADIKKIEGGIRESLNQSDINLHARSKLYGRNKI